MKRFTDDDFKIDTPDENGNITIPDELKPLFSKLGMQLRFHTLSGANEMQVVARMTKLSYKFFNPEHSPLTDSKHEKADERWELSFIQRIVVA